MKLHLKPGLKTFVRIKPSTIISTIIYINKSATQTMFPSSCRREAAAVKNPLRNWKNASHCPDRKNSYFNEKGIFSVTRTITNPHCWHIKEILFDVFFSRTRVTLLKFITLDLGTSYANFLKRAWAKLWFSKALCFFTWHYWKLGRTLHTIYIRSIQNWYIVHSVGKISSTQ